jgi:hypothetical protein
MFFGSAVNSLFAAGRSSDVRKRMRERRFSAFAATGPQAISVTVTPGNSTVMLGNQSLFTAVVKNSSDSTVTWSVNGRVGRRTANGNDQRCWCLYGTGSVADPCEPDGNGDQPRGRQQNRDGNCHGAE